MIWNGSTHPKGREHNHFLIKLTEYNIIWRDITLHNSHDWWRKPTVHPSSRWMEKGIFLLRWEPSWSLFSWCNPSFFQSPFLYCSLFCWQVRTALVMPSWLDQIHKLVHIFHEYSRIEHRGKVLRTHMIGPKFIASLWKWISVILLVDS